MKGAVIKSVRTRLGQAEPCMRIRKAELHGWMTGRKGGRRGYAHECSVFPFHLYILYEYGRVHLITPYITSERRAFLSTLTTFGI
jgi:hypothetical protein